MCIEFVSREAAVLQSVGYLAYPRDTHVCSMSVDDETNGKGEHFNLISGEKISSSLEKRVA